MSLFECSQQYSKYTHLLERYLEDKYKSATGAKEKIDRLNKIVSEDLAPARQMMENIYSQAGANQLAIVIKEIFDLI